MENPRNIEGLIEALADRESESPDAPLVSLYFEAHPQADRLEANGIHLKNVLADAAGQLETLGASRRDVARLRERVSAAAEDWKDGSGLDRGIAIFVDAERVTAIPLPVEVEELAVAASRFHLKPLFGALEHRQPFWLLALSQHEVSLYHGDGFGLREVDPGEDVPRSLMEVEGYQPDGRALLFHAVQRGGGEAQWHGRGAGKDDLDSEIEQFLKAVDEGLERLWQRTSKPVVLAGVEDLVATFRKLTKCRTLTDDFVEGNVEDAKVEVLQRRAWPLISRRLEDERRETLQRITEAGPDMPVARKLPDVLRAARGGRVDVAFLAGDARAWGSLDEKDFSVSTHDEFAPGDLDLLDRAAVETHRNGGTVHLVTASELPGKSVAVARLRY